MLKAVFFGASTVEGVGASAPERRFSAIVARTMGWEEINLGLGGTCVTGRDEAGQVTDEDSGLGRVPDVLAAAPDFVLVLHGANDFAQGRELGDPAQFRQGTFLWDYDTMIRGLLFELQPAQVAVCTCAYRADATTPNARGLTLSDYNQIIKNVGERYGLRVLDAYADAGMDSDNWHKLSDDGVHPNDAGHQCLAAFVIQALHEKPLAL